MYGMVDDEMHDEAEDVRREDVLHATNKALLILSFMDLINCWTTNRRQCEMNNYMIKGCSVVETKTSVGVKNCSVKNLNMWCPHDISDAKWLQNAAEGI